MESGIQSSFIPKDAGKVSGAPRLERSGGLSDLLLLISIVLLVASCALAGAVFLYGKYLETTATNDSAQLKSAQAAFDPTLISQITRLDDRMRAADTILSTHTAPTALFAALEQSTLTTISFSSLDLEASDPTKITLQMSGIAHTVNSIALEADVLSKDGVITNPIFSGISQQADGVHFDLSALVNPSTINYVSLVSQLLAANGGAQPAAAAQTTNPYQSAASTTPPSGATTQPPVSSGSGTGGLPQ